jgi:hypothetical protein
MHFSLRAVFAQSRAGVRLGILAAKTADAKGRFAAAGKAGKNAARASSFGAFCRKSIFTRQDSAAASALVLDFSGKRRESSCKMWPNIVRGALGIILRHAGFLDGFAMSIVRSRGFWFAKLLQTRSQSLSRNALACGFRA